MDAEELMEDIGEEQEWGTEERLQIALKYINNLGDNEDFEKYLERVASSEKKEPYSKDE